MIKPPDSVILTLIAEDDCQRLADDTKMSEIAKKAVARITREAFEQGGVFNPINSQCGVNNLSLSTN